MTLDNPIIKDTLSVKDAIVAMKQYKWSPKKVIELAKIGNLEFDEVAFLKALDEENQED